MAVAVATAIAVVPGAESAPATTQLRTYYIAADEVEWDYAPTGKDEITGQPFDEMADVFVKNGPDRIGRVYKKSLYREYTDSTFTTLKPVAPNWKHLGTLGPVIRGEVNDTIKIVFKNKTAYPASVHPHGVFYLKDSEGSEYDDGTTNGQKEDGVVQPGDTHVYEWKVPERAGPGPADPTSILWMYHSHVDEPGDTNAGLIGPMIITRDGAGNPDGSPKDVDREFVTMFTVFDENASPHLEDNIEAYAGDPASVDPEDEGFVESNLMHSINGFVYGNIPDLTMKAGNRVRWYELGMGTEVDLHTPHWHGQTLLWNKTRTDITELLPASMKTLDMVPDNPGTWLFHCHVNDHIHAGMMAKFKITP